MAVIQLNSFILHGQKEVRKEGSEKRTLKPENPSSDHGSGQLMRSHRMLCDINIKKTRRAGEIAQEMKCMIASARI